MRPVGPSISDCNSVTASDLSGITDIDLSGAGISTLAVDDFNGLSGVTDLNLSDNAGLVSLPDGIFDSLTALTSFDTGGEIIAMDGALPSLFILLVPDDQSLNLRPAFVYGDGGTIQPADSYEITFVSQTFSADRNEDSLRFQTTSQPGNLVALFIVAGSGIDFARNILFGQYTLTAAGIHGSDRATQTLTVEVAEPLPGEPPVCERTPEVRDAIVDEVTVTDCTLVTSVHLSNLNEIDLGDAGLSTLRSTDFNGLDGLTQLNLSTNNLTTLPTGIFDPLVSLERLNLSDNSFDEGLPFGIFDGLELTTFRISDTVAMHGALPSAITLTDENPSMTLDLRPAFVRGDGGGILPANPSEYSISGDYESVAEVSRENHATTITGISMGMTEVVISINSDADKEHRIRIDSQTERSDPIRVNPTSLSVEEGETADVVVSVGRGRTATLDAAYGAELSGPAQVEVPAGGEATWTIMADDPVGYQGNRTSTVRLSAPGYVSASVTVQLLENDADGLTIALESNSVELELGVQSELDVTIMRERGNREVNVTATSDNTGVVTVDAVSETMLSLSAAGLGSTSVTLTATGEGYRTATAVLSVNVKGAPPQGALPDIIVKVPETDTTINKITLAAGEKTTLSLSLSEILPAAVPSIEVTISTTPSAAYILLSDMTLSFSDTTPQVLTVSVSADDVPSGGGDSNLALVFSADGYTENLIPLIIRPNNLIFRIKVFLEGAQ